MMPLFPGLSGGGNGPDLAARDCRTSRALEKIVDVTKLQFLDNPTLKDLKAGVPDQGRPPAACSRST